MDIITAILLEGYDIVEIQKNLHKTVQLERLLYGYWLAEDRAAYLKEVSSGVFKEWNQIVLYKEKIDKLICTDDSKTYYGYFFRQEVQLGYVVSYRILSVDDNNEKVYLFDFEYNCIEEGFSNVLQWETELPYEPATNYINTYGVRNNIRIEEEIADDFELGYGGILYL